MHKNVASQRWVVFAFDRTDNTPKTGDAAQITAEIAKDGAALAGTNDTNPTELEDGFYEFDLTQAETNADELLLSPESSTADIQVIGCPAIVYTQPQYFSDLGIESDGHVHSDVKEISGDSTAADNLELQYDTTGLTGGTFPATQDAVGNLTSGSAAINTTAKDSPDGFVITTGLSEANTEDSTHALDGTTHDLEDNTGTTDAYYIFDIGGNGVPVSITWRGYAQGNGNSYAIHAYNWNTTAWEQVGTIDGSNGTTVWTETFDLTNAQVGTGASLGLVHFRFYSTDGTKFATDRITCAYAVVAQSVGYADGAVWVDTNASNTNTESYVDGTADNPVSTWAAAKTVATNMGLKKFEIANGSSITLDSNSDNYTFSGHEWTLALGGQSIANMAVEDATVTGVSSGSGAHFNKCTVGTGSYAACRFENCGFSGGSTITLLSADYYKLCNCGPGGGTPSPIFDFGAAIGNTQILALDWSGGIHIANLGQNGTDKISLTGSGKLTIDSTCSGGTIGMHGMWTILDNVVGGFVSGGGVLNDDARIDLYQINSEVDTALSDWGKAGFTLTNFSDANAAKLEDILDGTGGTGLTLDKLTIDANNADGGLYIDNAGGPGISATSSGGNGQGMELVGNGTGSGLLATGGATGYGVEVVGGSTSGDAIHSSATDGDGMHVSGGTNGHGLNADGAGTGEGIGATGGETGHGIEARGGVIGGSGFYAIAGPAGYDVDADIHGTIDTCTTNTDMVGTDGVPTNPMLATEDGSSFTAVPWNASWDTEVQSECDDALKALYLDHLLAATYDPANKPGVADGLLNEIVENDGGVSRFTANALEEAPTGGSAPTVGEIADAVWDEAIAGHTTGTTFGGKNQKAIPSETIGDYKATGFSTHDAAAVVTALGTGSTLTDCTTATGFSTHDAAAVVTALEADGRKLDHLWEMTEDDAGTRRYTANALEEAPIPWDKAYADHLNVGTFGILIGAAFEEV